MSDARRHVFEYEFKKFVISTTMNFDTRTINFHLYQDHFLEAVSHWPWLLCSNLGEHLEPCYNTDEVTYSKATSWQKTYWGTKI